MVQNVVTSGFGESSHSSAVLSFVARLKKLALIIAGVRTLLLSRNFLVWKYSAFLISMDWGSMFWSTILRLLLLFDMTAVSSSISKQKLIVEMIAGDSPATMKT